MAWLPPTCVNQSRRSHPWVLTLSYFLSPTSNSSASLVDSSSKTSPKSFYFSWIANSSKLLGPTNCYMSHPLDASVPLFSTTVLLVRFLLTTCHSAMPSLCLSQDSGICFFSFECCPTRPPRSLLFRIGEISAQMPPSQRGPSWPPCVQYPPLPALSFSSTPPPLVAFRTTWSFLVYFFMCLVSLECDRCDLSCSLLNLHCLGQTLEYSRNSTSVS